MTKYIIEIGYEGCSEPGCCSASKGFIFEASNLDAAETRADLSADDLDGWIIRCEEANEHDLNTYEVRQ